MELYEAGTDISAIAWKSLQQPQIQSQLDKPHNCNNNNNNNNKESKYVRKNDKASRSMGSLSLLKLINMDSYLSEKKKKRKASKNTYAKRQVDLDYRYYNSEMKNSLLYKYVYLIYKMMRDEKVDVKKYILHEDEREIPVNMAEFILGPDYNNKRLFKNDVNEIFSSMAHFIDFRKSKVFVEYMLSDGIKRFGLTVNHLIFPAIPMWLFDACSLVSKDPSLYLLYSTDIRSVNIFLGHISSIVNLSNLLFSKIEQNKNINATLILIHLVGIFTPDKYNPINRQGIKFPCNTLQRITFENVKNNMIKVAKEKRVYDNLSSFISSTIFGIPRVTGTNAFNLISY